MRLSNLMDFKYSKSNIRSYDTIFTQYAISSTNKYYLLHSLLKSRDLETKLNRINNIINCSNGNKFYKLYLDTKNCNWDLLKLEQGCNSRLCSSCMDKYKKKLRRIMRSNLDNFDSVRFMTPSFTSVKTLSKGYIKRCSRQFARLREYLARINTISKYRSRLHKLYKLGQLNLTRYKALLGYYNTYPPNYKLTLIQKYIIVLEFTYSEVTGWNLHYHMIYDGMYIPQELLGYYFKNVTDQDSYFVGIKYISPYDVRSKEKSLNYITKYLSKISFISDDYELLLEYYQAINKVRFYKVQGVKMSRLPYFYIHLLYWLSFMYSDSLVINEIYTNIYVEMEKFKLSKINLELSWEENLCLYGKTEVLLEGLNEDLF